MLSLLPVLPLRRTLYFRCWHRLVLANSSYSLLYLIGTFGLEHAQRLVGAIEIAGFYFHFTGEDSKITVSLIVYPFCKAQATRSRFSLSTSISL